MILFNYKLCHNVNNTDRIQDRTQHNWAQLTTNGGLYCTHISIVVYLKHLSIITLNFKLTTCIALSVIFGSS